MGGASFDVQALEAEQDDEITLDTASGTLTPEIIKRWSISKDAAYAAQELRYMNLMFYGESVLDNALGEIAIGWIYSTDGGVTWLFWNQESHSNAAYTAVNNQDADPVSGFPDTTTDIAFAIFNRFDAADGRAKHLKAQVLLLVPLGYTVTEV
jgi:hypothetical protein